MHCVSTSVDAIHSFIVSIFTYTQSNRTHCTISTHTHDVFDCVQIYYFFTLATVSNSSIYLGLESYCTTSVDALVELFGLKGIYTN